jgi:AraC-like DNA-binding protein
VRYIGQSPHDLDAAVDVLVIRHDLDVGDRFGTHHHPQQQLSWTPSGSLAAEVGDRSWLLPPTVGLWIPGDVPHDIRAARPGVFYGFYVGTDSPPITWTEPTIVSMPPVVQALVVHLAEAELGRDERARVEAVLFDNLAVAPDAHVVVPMPRDPHALAVARALVTHPADDRGLEDWGRHVGASRRTLVRIFAAETGLTFSRWRTQVRVSAATDHLVEGRSVRETAHLVGYDDPGAFIEAFHRVLGTTPGAYAAARASTAVAG